MKGRNRYFIPVLLVIGLFWASVRFSQAFSSGISGVSGMQGTTCTLCHSGGVEPVVALSGPTAVSAGQMATYQLTVTSTNPISQTAAGLNAAIAIGEMLNDGADTQVLNGEITHTGPKPNNVDGTATFTFHWTPPITATGTFTMYAAGNSVNQNGDNSGDAPGTDTLLIQVQTPTDVSLSGLDGDPAGFNGGWPALIPLFIIGLGLIQWQRRSRNEANIH
jgi:hypothetical protein